MHSTGPLLILAALLALSASGSPPALAQAQPAPAAPATRQVTISDAAWLAGRWTGEGLGGRLDEGWADPVGGQMAGYFTLSRDGRPVFHEMLLMEEHEGGLRLRVKHFNPDFTGWEEKDRSVDFTFVSAAPGELVFKGIRFDAEGPDGLVIRLRLRGSDGLAREEVLRYRRVP